MDGQTHRGLASSPDEESASVMTQPAPAAAGEPGGWKIDRVGIKSAENGGFIVDCSKTRSGTASSNGNPSPTSDYQSKDYAFSSLPEVLTFLQEEFGQGSAAAPVAPAGPPITGY